MARHICDSLIYEWDIWMTSFIRECKDARITHNTHSYVNAKTHVLRTTRIHTWMQRRTYYAQYAFIRKCKTHVLRTIRIHTWMTHEWHHSHMNDASHRNDEINQYMKRNSLLCTGRLRKTGIQQTMHSHTTFFEIRGVKSFVPVRINGFLLHDGEDPEDALSLWVIFRKRALQLVALLQKETCDLRHPMHLCHPVATKSRNLQILWFVRRLCHELYQSHHELYPSLLSLTASHGYLVLAESQHLLIIFSTAI